MRHGQSHSIARERVHAPDRCGSGPHASQRPPRRSRSHRHKIRLRRRAVRGMHRAGRWRRHEIVPDQGERRGREEGGHDRRARAGGQAAPGAGGLPRSRRAAVRLLHAGHDHGRGVAVAAQSAPERTGNRHRNERPHLPLRDVPEGGARDSRRRRERRPGMKRRDFFAVLGGGILVMIAEDDDPIFAQETGGQLRGGAMPADVSAWLHIAESGAITVYTGKVEVGQNARTSLTQAAAEELRVPPASIKMVMGDTAISPFDGGTVGSQTTPRMWPQIRRAAASAREMLLDLAAQKWSVERASLKCTDGKITAGARSATFGELTRGEKLTHAIPSSLPLVPSAEWKVAGTSLAKVNGREIVTGAHRSA